jgi:hypothetical protein
MKRFITYAIFYNLLVLNTSYIKMLSSAPYSQVRSALVPSLISQTEIYTHTEQQGKLHFCMFIF